MVCLHNTSLRTDAATLLGPPCWLLKVLSYAYRTLQTIRRSSEAAQPAGSQCRVIHRLALGYTCPSLVYRRLLPVAVISPITYSSHGHVTWCYSWTTRVLRSGSLTWNAIPDAVRDPAVSLTDFRQPQKLKTYLVIWLWELAVWLSGNALASINVVALRQTQLVLGWVTVFGRVNHFGM